MSVYIDMTVDGLRNLTLLASTEYFRLDAEITIPAGEKVTLNSTFKKNPSFDFYCAASENKGVSGYDLVTALGSNLTFTQQMAKLEDRGQIEIVHQNFGFDLEKEINEVGFEQSALLSGSQRN